MLWFFVGNDNTKVYGGFKTMDEMNAEMAKHGTIEYSDYTIIDAKTREEAERKALIEPVEKPVVIAPSTEGVDSLAGHPPGTVLPVVTSPTTRPKQ